MIKGDDPTKRQRYNPEAMLGARQIRCYVVDDTGRDLDDESEIGVVKIENVEVIKNPYYVYMM